MSLPGASQVKSLCQLVTGDVEGATRTQENFIKECPGVSQVTSTVQAATGNSEGAIETQRRFAGGVGNIVNAIPGVGHIKGAVHHAMGDHELGNKALNSATRTTVILGSGITAGLTTAGLAAIPAGIAAATTYDLVDSAVSEKPKGIVADVDELIINQKIY